MPAFEGASSRLVRGAPDGPPDCLAALAPALLATDCELPFAPEEGHRILYVHVLEPGSSFVYPPAEEFVAAAEEVRAYFLEASYGRYRLEGVDDPVSAGDVVGPIVVDPLLPLECGLEHVFVEDVLWLLRDTIDFRRWEHVAIVAPLLGCGINGRDVFPFLVPVFGELTEVDAIYVNAQSLYYTGTAGSGPGITAHELGHQLGLLHSRAMGCDPVGVVFDAGCDDGEFLDFIDVMGAIAFFGHFNAFQKQELGWIPAASALEVTASGRYLLTPYESRSLGPKLPSGVDWIGVERVAEIDAAGATSFDDEIVLDALDPGDDFEVVAFDTEGNAARVIR